MSNADTSGIHRRLDDAFAGIAVTPELQDLKEELRGNLAARVAELRDGGATATDAAARAIDELGDIDALISSFAGPDAGPDAVRGSQPVSDESIAELAQRNRVRPRPLFVVRTVILSLLLATGIVLAVLGALGVLPWATPALLAIVAGAIALPAGVIVADSLRQETSQHYASPASRAVGFGLAAAAMGLGVFSVVVFLGDLARLPVLIAGLVLVVVAIVAFTWLGVTQTNRTKPWALAMQRRYAAEDPFAQNPAAAARFGMYTISIWVLTFAAFGVLSATVGFGWSWIAIIVGLVTFLLTLARMVFPSKPAR